MILGVGIDTVSVTRIGRLNKSFEGKFARKVFTENEISQADEKHGELAKDLFYAKRFAAKEAFAKALGLGIGRGVNFRDIEVINDSLGKPEIRILNNKEQFIKDHFSCKNFVTHLSITDENPTASAIVIIDKIS